MSSRKESKFCDDYDDDDFYNARHNAYDQKRQPNHNPRPAEGPPVWTNPFLSTTENLSRFIKLEPEEATTSASIIPRFIKQEKNTDTVTTTTVVKKESSRIADVNVDIFPEGINNLCGPKKAKNKIKVEKTVVAETSRTFAVKIERTPVPPVLQSKSLHRSYSNQPDVKINPVNNPFKICNFLNSTKSKFQSDVKINTSNPRPNNYSGQSDAKSNSATSSIKSDPARPVPFRSTKLTDPNPLPQRIQNKVARRLSNPQNMTDSERESRRRQRYKRDNTLGYEGRSHHRHAHQAERQKEYERYMNGGQKDDDDSDDYYNRD
ncbi:uncharacterized protein LOC110860896 [Folsomia candida]|uniref:uncharacterized protein LOC110860896 n=1 Tax=Folsomia candida TaxID=158441 RepID=UPI000B909ACF|nr:uncharacterized protein LOC110860896 [Folsomia candida]